MNVLKEVSAAAAEALGDSFLGLHMAEINERGTFGVLDFIGQHAPDLRRACEGIVRYQRLISDRTRFSLTVRGDEAAFEHDLGGIPEAAGRHANEFTIASLVRRIRELSAPDFSPTRVWFSHASPGDVSELRRYFGGCEITFGAPNNGFAFPVALLDRPMVNANEELARILDAHARLLLPALPDPDPTLALRLEIAKRIEGGAPDVRSIAALLKTSSRTLQRRLREHGTSYQDVVDDVRRRMALDHLTNTSLPVREIAFLLGYTESRSFLRAFKRWTGVTPSEQRARGSAQAPASSPASTPPSAPSIPAPAASSATLPVAPTADLAVHSVAS